MTAPDKQQLQNRPRSRSNSPLPPAPVDSGPGPRAQALQKVFAQALDATLKKCSYDNFAACFPTPARFVPDTLEGLHQQFIAKLEAGCQNHFDKILLERGVVASLNHLDRLLDDARARKSAAEEAARAHAAASGEGGNGGSSIVLAPPAMHTLPPTALLNAHLQPFLASQHAALSAALSALQTANAALHDEAASQHAQIEAYTRNLDAVVADLQRSADMVQGQEVQPLGKEITELEAELSV